jgi:amino acid transporter
MSRPVEEDRRSRATGHHEAGGLERSHLGAGQITALAIASQTPAVALATVPFLLVVTAGNGSWLGALLAALVTACVGIAVIVFARRYVVTGSLYSYASHVFRPWARLLIGACLLAGYVALLAGVLLLTGTYAGSFLIASGVASGLGPVLMTLLTTAALLVSAGFAYRGLDSSIRTAVILTVVTVPLVLLITVAVAMKTGLHLQEQLTLAGSSASGIFQGIAAATVFLVAFESSAALAAETRDPRHSVPRAVMSVPVVLGVAYLVVTFLQVPGLIATSAVISAGMSPPAALAIEAGLGTTIATATDLVLAIANLSSIIAFLNYGSRFVATLATDGLLPAPLARVHARFKSPTVAVISLAAAAQCSLLLLTWLYPNDLMTKVFPALSTLTVYLWVVPWILTCIGAVILVARQRSRVVGTAFAAFIGVVGMGWIYVNGIINAPPAPADAMSYVFLVVGGLGLLIFAILDRRRRVSANREATTSSRELPPI